VNPVLPALLGTPSPPTWCARSCGSTVEVGDHEVEAWAAEVATKHGFSDVSHTIEIYGTCSDLPPLDAALRRYRAPISAPLSSTINSSVRSASSLRPLPGKL